MFTYFSKQSLHFILSIKKISSLFLIQFGTTSTLTSYKKCLPLTASFNFGNCQESGVKLGLYISVQKLNFRFHTICAIYIACNAFLNLKKKKFEFHATIAIKCFHTFVFQLVGNLVLKFLLLIAALYVTCSYITYS